MPLLKEKPMQQRDEWLMAIRACRGEGTRGTEYITTAEPSATNRLKADGPVLSCAA
jgi:hypothetical protein